MGIGSVVANLKPGASTQILPGAVISIDWPTQSALVNVSGGTITAALIGIPPTPGDAVQVLIAGGAAVVLGIASRAAEGTVATDPAGGLVQVMAEDGNTYRLPYGDGLTLTAGSTVVIDWSAGGLVVQKISGTGSPVTPPAPTPPPPSSGGAASVQKSRVFSPTVSASRRNGGWAQGTVYFGQSYSSAGWFYGAQIADSIPDDATEGQVSIYLEVTASSGLPYLTLGMHDQKTIPAGDVILSDYANIGGANSGFRGWVPLPDVFFDRLSKGLMFGITTKGPGYRRMTGAPTTGALRITWKE